MRASVGWYLCRRNKISKLLADVDIVEVAQRVTLAE